MKPAGLGPTILAGCAIAVGHFASRLSAEMNPTIRAAGLEAHESHAGASLIGQFRTSTAAWMFLRADLYLHNGVEMRALTKAEKERGSGGVGGSGTNPELEKRMHDDAIVTVVPAEGADFRGVFGDLERATSSYRDMRGHQHNDLETCMPLFRLMTWVDPSFIAGWTYGAMVLAGEKRPDAADRALTYLKEGLTQNPDCIEIVSQMGTITITGRKQIPEGVALLEKARKIAQTQRGRVSESESEAALETYRWLTLAYNKLKRPTELAQVGAEGLKRFPDDKVIKRLSGRS